MSIYSNNEINKWQQASKVLSSILGEKAHVSPLVLYKIFSEEKLQKRLHHEVGTAAELQAFLEEIKEDLRDQDRTSFVLEPSSSELVWGGLSSFWKWMADGFNIVSPERLETRLQVCRNCPYFQEAGTGLLYNLINKLAGSSPVCGKCGCTIFKKAKITTLSCPVEDPQKPGYTLWGDLLGTLP